MKSFDIQDGGVRSLNAYLHQAESASQEVEVTHPGGSHNVAAGAIYDTTVDVHGHVGYYCAGMNQNAGITVHGNAGPGLAENMMSGLVRVTGNASQYCGATGHGGLLVVEGNAAARCGISMKGVNIVVGGSIGHMSAFMAQSGALVVCGDAGDSLGDSIYEARIYVRGKVSSLGADCVEKNMREQHIGELAGLLKQAGLTHDPAEFTRYGSARKLYNFKIDNVGAY
jgi:glutamate synthase domain-containing protein 3